MQFLPQPQPERHPASLTSGPPPCWSLYRGSDTCQVCDWQVSCQRRTVAYQQRVTVAQAVAALPSPDPGFLPATLVDLLDLVDAAWSAVAPGRRRQLTDSKTSLWRQSFQVILDICTVEGWDARLYIQAQIDSLFKFMVSCGHAPNPGHFIGQGANLRFMKWCHARRKGRGDERSPVITDAVALARRRLAACCEFATRFMSGGTLEDAVTHATTLFPDTDIPGAPPDYQLRALESGLASVDPALPARVLLPTDGVWSWEDARQIAGLLIAISVEDGSPPDDDLGWLGDLV